MISDDRESPATIPVSAILVEQGAEELLRSPEAQPYRRLAEAVVTGRDTGRPARDFGAAVREAIPVAGCLRA